MDFVLGIIVAWGLSLMSTPDKCRCPSDARKQLDRLMLERDILGGKRTVEQVDKEILELMERNTQLRKEREAELRTPLTRSEMACVYSVTTIIFLVCLSASVLSVVCFVFRYRPEPCVGCEQGDWVCELQRFFMGEPPCHEPPPDLTFGSCEGELYMAGDGSVVCMPRWTDCAKEKC